MVDTHGSSEHTHGPTMVFHIEPRDWPRRISQNLFGGGSIGIEPLTFMVTNPHSTLRPMVLLELLG